ncbi:unnamed protein product [Calicophoron daubneyi]|uniref:Amino acid transporter transmembrane domain-containing protein n=1 Tax=Calicophoron daubneyi TaxID=300641 RepID=A0AAV2TEX6_CALDB
MIAGSLPSRSLLVEDGTDHSSVKHSPKLLGSTRDGTMKMSADTKTSTPRPGLSVSVVVRSISENTMDEPGATTSFHRRYSTVTPMSRGRKTSVLLINSLVSSLREAQVPASQRRREGILPHSDKRQSMYRHFGLSNREKEPEIDVYNLGETFEDVHRFTPTWVAGWNVLNLIQGVGILGVPYACAHAGWVSIPVILLVALICWFTGRLLGECLYKYPDTDCKKYFTSPEQLKNRERVRPTTACIAACVLPRGGSQFAAFVVMLELFGGSILYIILLGQSAHALLGPVLVPHWPTAYWTAIMVCFCIPVLMIPRMHVVARLSVIALVGLFLTIILVLVYCAFMFPLDEKILLSRMSTPQLSELPLSLSIILLSYCAHAALPGIEDSMEKPEQYAPMLGITFAVAGIVKLVFGILSTLVFGSQIAQAVTDSMIGWPSLVYATHAFVLINVFFSIPLIMYLMGEQLDLMITEYVGRDFFSSSSFCSIYKIWFVSTRLVLITLGLGCAALVPQFALVMGLIGAVTGSLLCFIFPASFHLYLFWSHLNLFSKVLRILVSVFGFLVMIFGVVFSIISMVENFASDGV